MSLTVPIQGKTRSYAATLATTGTIAVFKAKPKTQSVLVAVNLANIDGSVAVDATVEWYRAANLTAYRVASTLSVAADTRQQIDFPLAMDADDELRVTAGAGGDLAVIVTVVETPGNT